MAHPHQSSAGDVPELDSRWTIRFSEAAARQDFLARSRWVACDDGPAGLEIEAVDEDGVRVALQASDPRGRDLRRLVAETGGTITAELVIPAKPNWG